MTSSTAGYRRNFDSSEAGTAFTLHSEGSSTPIGSSKAFMSEQRPIYRAIGLSYISESPFDFECYACWKRYEQFEQSDVRD